MCSDVARMQRVCKEVLLVLFKYCRSASVVDTRQLPSVQKTTDFLKQAVPLSAKKNMLHVKKKAQSEQDEQGYPYKQMASMQYQWWLTDGLFRQPIIVLALSKLQSTSFYPSRVLQCIHFVLLTPPT